MADIDSLYQICIKKTVDLIKDDYWFSVTEHGFNPFRKYPFRNYPEIIHSLIAEVIDDNENCGYLDTYYLYPLLTSSCVRELVIKDVLLNWEVLEAIFVILSTSCENIEKIQLVNCEVPFSQPKGKDGCHHALKDVILGSKKLNFLESCIPFDLELLSNMKNLDVLILHFTIPNLISVASMTCPDLEAIKILAEDPDGLEYLSNFQKLKDIDIAFELLENISDMNDVFQKSGFGDNIKSISICNTIDFDLSVIANSCPNLIDLKLYFCNGSNSQAFVPKVFSHLHNLELTMLDEKIVEDSLVIMLANAFLLKSLKLSFIPKFNNEMFEDILRINPLTYMTTLHLIHTRATKDGIFKFEKNLNIQSFRLSAGGP